MRSSLRRTHVIRNLPEFFEFDNALLRANLNPVVIPLVDVVFQLSREDVEFIARYCLLYG